MFVLIKIIVSIQTIASVRINRFMHFDNIKILIFFYSKEGLKNR